MSDIFNKKFVIATILALAIILAWDQFFLKDIRERDRAEKLAQAEEAKKPQTGSYNPSTSSVSSAYVSSGKAKGEPRLALSNENIDGSIALRGAKIDDISLKHYKETLDSNSKEIKIFDFNKTPKAYFFDSGWISSSNIITPNSDSLWLSDNNNLTEKKPVALSWKSPQGIIFKKVISLDDKYIITVTDSIENPTNQNITVIPFALILRHNEPDVLDVFISHEGFVGYVDKTLERVKYSSVKEKKYEFNGYSSYVGFTDKYWLSAILPENKNQVTSRFISFKDNQNIINYQADYKGHEVVIEPKQSYSNVTRLFVGPKEYNVISNYEKQLKIDNFDDTIDFGWFFFFTKPMISFLLWIYHTVGNFGLAILIFTIVVRVIILPIAYKSYISMAKMRELQPKMKSLKERYGSDMQKYNKELMALYKKEKVNPLSGCLPIFLQIPIFFSIYKVIFVSIELRHAPFWGWISDMSVLDPTNIFNLFGLLPFNPPSFLHIGIWPILMGVTMFIQQKISATQVMDGMQQKIMNAMPVILVFVLASFPSGLVIYWTWSNVISIVQQYFINKKVHSQFDKKPVVIENKQKKK